MRQDGLHEPAQMHIYWVKVWAIARANDANATESAIDVVLGNIAALYNVSAIHNISDTYLLWF